MARVPSRSLIASRLLVLLMPALAAVCGGNELVTTSTTTPLPQPAATTAPAPAATPEATAVAPPVTAAGEMREPNSELYYPDEFTQGEMITGGLEVRDRIYQRGTLERASLDADIEQMMRSAPAEASGKFVMGLNLTGKPSWTLLPGDSKTLWVAGVLDNGATLLDPFLHNWRAEFAPGVSFDSWQKIEVPTGLVGGDGYLQLTSNGGHPVIGAYRADGTLAGWLNIQKYNNGSGDWDSLNVEAGNEGGDSLTETGANLLSIEQIQTMTDAEILETQMEILDFRETDDYRIKERYQVEQLNLSDKVLRLENDGNYVQYETDDGYVLMVRNLETGGNHPQK